MATMASRAAMKPISVFRGNDERHPARPVVDAEPSLKHGSKTLGGGTASLIDSWVMIYSRGRCVSPS